MKEIRAELPGREEVTITLEAGETYPGIGTTKKEFVGPGVVRFIDHNFGYTTLLVDETTARLRYKANTR